LWEIRVVFCDISKAFDRLHIGLLNKIESIGIQGPLLSWINKITYQIENREYTGVTFANFHSVGNILVDNERLKSLHRLYFNID
jgi:hypothetical protein